MTDFFAFALNRFVFRISSFIRHWYLGGFKIFSHFFISTLERMDRFFALKISLRHFFDPLYQDATIIGKVLGPFFRFFRIILGGVMYAFLFIFVAIGFLFWAAIPFILVFEAGDHLANNM